MSECFHFINAHTGSVEYEMETEILPDDQVENPGDDLLLPAEFFRVGEFQLNQENSLRLH